MVDTKVSELIPPITYPTKDDLLYIVQGGVSKSIKVGPFIGDFNVRTYGADPIGIVSAVAGIQGAIDAAYAAGGGHVVANGIFLIDQTITGRHGVTISGPFGAWGRPGFPENSAATFKAAAGFAGPVIRLDPADIDPSHLNIRGAGLRDLAFDMRLAPTATAIMLRSLSNAPVFSNLTVYGCRGTALDLDTSANTGARMCEGLTFYNFLAYAFYNVTPQTLTAPLVKIVGANEIAFRDGKLLLEIMDSTSGFPVVLIQADDTNGFIADGITFDGMSTTSCNVHYRVQGVGTSSPRHVRWENCTFEGYNVGIQVNKSSPPSVRSIGLFVEQSNRFFGSTGANPKKIDADWVEQSVFKNEYSADNSTVNLGADAIWNVVYGPWNGTIDAGKNATIDQDQYGGGIILSPSLSIMGASGTFVWVQDTTNNSEAIFEALDSDSRVGSYSNHPFYIISKNTPRIHITETGEVGIPSAVTGHAILELSSTTQGFLLPRMSTTQRDAIGGTTEGLVIYNLTTHKLNFHNGTSWVEVTSP